MALAQSGSGKTLGYLLPAAARIIANEIQETGKRFLPPFLSLVHIIYLTLTWIVVVGVRALMLVPTRELAQQVAKQAARIYQATSAAALTKEKKNVKPIRALAVYGGVDAEAQKEVLLERQAQLLIATPGRLVDLLEWSLTLEEKQPKKKVKGAADQIKGKRKGKVVIRTPLMSFVLIANLCAVGFQAEGGLLSNVDTLVFDEADKMMQLGFEEQLKKIVSHLSGNEKRWLFSATFPPAVKQLASQFIRDGVCTYASDFDRLHDIKLFCQSIYILKALDS